MLAEVNDALDEAMFRLELVLLGNNPKSPKLFPLELEITPVAKAF